MSEVDAAADRAAFRQYGEALAASIEAAMPRWVSDAVTLRAGATLTDANRSQVTEAGRSAAVEIGRRLRELLVLDIDEQWTNPLTITRTAVVYPTAVLRSLGVAEVARDQFAASHDPDDVYDLTPAAFADFGQDAHERGLMWGAAKAHLHLQRRRAEGR